ncbi:MAG: DUF1284 domain-containing protein [Clostridia bacterium]|nr:DUF1284 domain-containing protein [Clostridia bacterium]
MKLRPHHILCIGNFIGYGYSEAFTENMKKIRASLSGGEEVTITEGADDICRYCPDNRGGICLNEDKAGRYDGKTAEILGLSIGNVYSYEQLRSGADERIYKTNEFHGICADCEWYETCRAMHK